MIKKKTYKVSKSLILQKLDGKLVGFDVDKSSLYTFNETAEFIFRKIKAKWEEDKIVAALAKKYDVSLLTLKKDVKGTIREMVKNKIINI